MADNEFSIIDRYFSNIGWQGTGDEPELGSVTLGPGDDCAILSMPASYELCVSTDTLLSGVHFPIDCAADGRSGSRRHPAECRHFADSADF